MSATKSAVRPNELWQQAASEARARGVLIWLVIDAPWNEACAQWMSAFESPELATLRDAFQILRISRDEAPEWDTAAQSFIQTEASRSGWPLSLFVSPDGVPVFVAGSLTVESSLELLPQLASAWALDPETLEEEARKRLEDFAARDPQRLSAGDLAEGESDSWLEDKILGAAMAPLSQSLDFETGIVGAASDAHQYPAVYRCLTGFSDTSKLAGMALTGLARSHLCDVIGGGFFRSAHKNPDKPVSTEMLLTENAELLEAILAYRDDSKSEFARQAAADLVWRLLTDFLRDEGVGFASSLSGSAAYYRFEAADLIKAVPGAARQPAQMFFGIESGGQVPYLPTELPMLSSFLRLPPVDLLHGLQDSKKRLREFRETERAALKPKRGARLLGPEARLMPALVMAYGAGLLTEETYRALTDSILNDWGDKPWLNFADGDSPRTRWSVAIAWLAMASEKLHANFRLEGLKLLSLADEVLEDGLRPAAVQSEIPFLGSRARWDSLDHLGASSVGLRLRAIELRARIASEQEGNREKSRFLAAQAGRPCLAQALKLARPLGLHAASIYEARLKNPSLDAPHLSLTT